MKRIALTLVFAAAFLGACGTNPPRPDPPGPTPAANCSTACANLRAHACPSGSPTAGGITCEALCERLRTSGAYDVDFACLTAAPSCEAADECGAP